MRTSICACLLLIACSQDSGEPCQKQSDCSDNLICDIAPRSDRGVCRAEPKEVDVDDTVQEADAQVVGGGDPGGGDVPGGDAGGDDDAG